MKKFIKVCGITVLILCLAGLVMVLVAVSTKGTAGVEAVVEQVTGGRGQGACEPGFPRR